MTNQELRIAKLAKILNSTWQEKNSANPAIKEAFGRAETQLKETIRNEKDFNQETEERQRMQAKIEKQEEIIKENIRKHHFIVLKKQIEDRKRQRDISYVEKLMEKPKPAPRTPPEPPRFFHRENLKDQIKAKKKQTKESQKNELDMDRFFIKVSKLSLEEDFKQKQVQKEAIYNELKQSWENSKALNKLKKEADRLKFFGNVTLRKNIKADIPRSQSKEKPSLTPKLTKKVSKSQIPQIENRHYLKVKSSETTPVKLKIYPQSPIKPDTQKKPYRENPETPQKLIENIEKNQSPKKLDIIERLEKIKREEEAIKSSKKEIIEYLTSRTKSKY